MSRPRRLATLAWRESRFARRRLFLFLSAISLGVAAVVAVDVFAAALGAGVRNGARALLGADLALSARRPLGPGAEALLDSLAAAGAEVARATSFTSMAVDPRTGATRLAQVRAIEDGWPFYGRVVTQPAGAWEWLGDGRNAVADGALLTALGVPVGDSIALGEARFEVLGTLREVPGEAELASAFAPRLYVPAARVAEMRLLGFGSRVEHEAFVRLREPERAAELARRYGPALRAEHARVRTAEEQQRALDREVGRLGSFLGLAGVIALLVGGVGVASAMRAYLEHKSEAIATLRCLGATSRDVLAVYLLQAAGMGLLGAAAGVAIGLAAGAVLPRLAADLLPIRVGFAPDPWIAARGLGVGFLTAIGFSLPPLVATRRISPLEALRRRVERGGRERDPLAAGCGVALAGAGALLVVQRTGSLVVGAALAAGVAATLGLLLLLGWVAVRASRRTRPARASFPVRQGIAGLHRPGSRAAVVIGAVGLGVFLLATLLLTEHALLRPLRPANAPERANLVLWDVQDDQAEGVAALLRSRGLPVNACPSYPCASTPSAECRRPSSPEARRQGPTPAGGAARRTRPAEGPIRPPGGRCGASTAPPFATPSSAPRPSAKVAGGRARKGPEATAPAPASPSRCRSRRAWPRSWGWASERASTGTSRASWSGAVSVRCARWTGPDSNPTSSPSSPHPLWCRPHAPGWSSPGLASRPRAAASSAASSRASRTCRRWTWRASSAAWTGSWTRWPR